MIRWKKYCQIGLWCIGLCSLNSCSTQVISDWANIQILEDGDVWTGRDYTVKAENAVNIKSKYGTITDGRADNEYIYHFDPAWLDSRSVSFPIVDEFSYATPSGKTFSRRIRLYEQDPLLRYQWHIYNNGSNHFGVKYPPLKGIDLNVIPAWHRKDHQGNPISGKGVTVALLDLPVDVKQEDLINQIDDSINVLNPQIINTGIVYDNLKKTRGGELHGTSVAGLISAEGFNGKGIRGIAYGSRLYSVTALSSPHEKAPQISRSLLIDALKQILLVDQAQVVNASIGADLLADNDETGELLAKLYDKNIPLIHSSGNEYMLTSWQGREINKLCKKYKTDCRSSVTNYLSRSAQVIHVAAVNAGGVKSSYSSTRANMWVSALGGEDGYRLQGSDAPGVVSTLSSYTCKQNQYDFDGDRSPWRTFGDQSCFYTAKMKGTSAAAPEITGIVALLKQVNPDFTVEQIRYFLAQAARSDQKIASLKYDPVATEGGLVADPGWISNAAGYRYSNRFGFGLVDADVAVKTALNCSADAGCQIRSARPVTLESGSVHCHASTDGYECNLGDFSYVGDNRDASASAHLDEIETVTLTFGSIFPQCFENRDFNSFDNLVLAILPFYTKLQVELSSASDTTSIIKSAFSSWLPLGFLSNYDPAHFLTMASSSFYREPLQSDAKWQVKIKNLDCPIDINDFGRSVKLTISGYQK